MSEYELVVTPPAQRALERGVSEGVATAVIEFLTGSLIAAPRRVGNEVRDLPAGSAH